MALHPLQQRFHDRFFPGLIEAIQGLGAGEFEANTPKLKCVGTDKIRAVTMRLRYVLPTGLAVEIRTSARLKDGRPLYDPKIDVFNPAHWERYSYSLHLGRSFTDCVFRFDLDDDSGYHVHIKPNTDDHVPASLVEPDTSNMAPLRFVQIVARYLSDHVYPVQWKQP